MVLMSLLQARVPVISARWALRILSRARSRTRERFAINDLVIFFQSFGSLLLAFE